MKWILTLCLLAPPALAETCPAAADHSEKLGQIITDLSAAKGEGDARVLSQQLWMLWLDAPDAKAQALLDEGMQQRNEYDFLGARDTLDALVEYCPDYAEGYNQRAFASFLRRDYDAALIDLDTALLIMPNHVAALSGKALTLFGLGRDDEGQEVLREALKLNPWLQERALLSEPLGTEL
jgi:tetratricopeptide (TPR) repeat protein